MNYRQLYLAVSALVLISGWAGAQPEPEGEAAEPSPEELDAAFTEEDAAREAAAWSDVVVDRGRPDPLEAMTASADLVFRGTVVSQEFVYDEKDLPWTHTTFAISETLKGSHSSPKITLIQEGGVSKHNPENIVIVSDAHYFNEGEAELLFLKLDPARSGPRRSAIEKRFRIHDGKVYDENGRGVLLDVGEDGETRRLGLSRDRNPAPRFRQVHIGPHTLTKNFGERHGVPDIGGESPRERRDIPGYQSSVDIATFAAAIRN